MASKNVFYFDTNKIFEMNNTLKQLNEDHEVKSIHILVADGSDSLKRKLKQYIPNVQKNLFGGVFPKIVHNDHLYDDGCLIVGLPFETETHIIKNLSDSSETLEPQLKALSEKIGSSQSMFIYVDGLSSGIGDFIEGVYNHLGSEHNYIGGGCGSLSFEQAPCLISNEGFLQDGALVIKTNRSIGVGVSHGWKKLAGPFRVTESSKNKIISLDWKPAFEVYKDIIENHSNKKFNDDNFFDLAKSYPFGINKIDSEVIVRDPIVVEDNQLVCVGEVPENEYVHILMGTESSLINAAEQAKNIAVNKVQNDSGTTPLFLMDCISRVLFLEEDFSKELQVIRNNKDELIGALCLGEIANSGSSCLEFFNKTCVVGKIGKAS